MQVPLKPLVPLRFVELSDIAPHRVLTDYLAHAQQPGIDAVAAQPIDVRVALVTSEDRQHRRAQHIPFRWRIGAAQV